MSGAAGEEGVAAACRVIATSAALNARAQPARSSIGAARRSFAPWTDPGAVPLIRFESVTKRFGATAAVDDVSLDIFEREFFCLLGPSGCGKTTLMRMLAGFETPSAGRIILGGQDLAGVPPYRRPVNMMFQSYALFPHMSVEKNIAFGLKQDGHAAGAEIARRASPRCCSWCSSRALPSASRTSSPAASASAWRSPARSPSGRRCCCSTSRSRALDKKLREETQFELMDIQVTARHDLRRRHARPGRGDDHGGPHRGDGPAAGSSRSRRPARSTSSRETRFVAEFVGDINIVEGQVAAGEDGGWQIEDAARRGTAHSSTIRARRSRPGRRSPSRSGRRR